MQYAPIVLFTYNRPDKTQKVLESLLQNAEAKDSDLFIFSDGPKNEKAVEGVRKNREYLESFKRSLLNREGWGGSVTIIEREKNWGLANSLIAGITEVINKYERVIVVEDDLVLSPYFLKFMNDGLNLYYENENVGAICGYIFPVNENLPDTFFLKFLHPWGWATWKRSWALFNPDAHFLLKKLRFKKKEFDLGGYCGCYGNLYCHKVGIVNSWYVRFYASLFLSNKLSLFPKQTLVENAGLDGSGIHCSSIGKRDMAVLYKGNIETRSIAVTVDKSIYKKIGKFLKHTSNESGVLFGSYHRFKSFVRRLLYIDCR